MALAQSGVCGVVLGTGGGALKLRSRHRRGDLVSAEKRFVLQTCKGIYAADGDNACADGFEFGKAGEDRGLSMARVEQRDAAFPALLKAPVDVGRLAVVGERRLEECLVRSKEPCKLRVRVRAKQRVAILEIGRVDQIESGTNVTKVAVEPDTMRCGHNGSQIQRSQAGGTISRLRRVLQMRENAGQQVLERAPSSVRADGMHLPGAVVAIHLRHDHGGVRSLHVA